MRIVLLLAALSAASPALAQTFSGPAVVIDGDTFDLGNERIRLHGIDAMERGQTCGSGEDAWKCGEVAKQVLSDLTAGERVDCTQVDRDRYGRVVAKCRTGRTDLSQVMADEGLAIALTGFSDDYVADEARAKAYGKGIWAGAFELPSDFRAANPGLVAPAVRKVQRAPQVRADQVFYRGCDEVRRAGKAPLYRGQPGYRADMDGDGDGIACEPYRGRR